jgi:outer membrane protein OmpA-like peptidoglycan-associated protein
LDEAYKAMDEKNYSAAVEYFSNAYSFDTSDMDIAYDFATSARNYEAYPLADSLYAMVIKKESDGEYPEATFWRAMMRQRLGDYIFSTQLFRIYISEQNNENPYLTRRAKKEMKANKWAMDYLEYLPDSPYIEHMSENINTPSSEFGVYARGDTIYYSSLRFENEEDDSYPPKPLSKILVSENGSEGVVLEGINNDSTITAHTTFSEDGNRIYYTLCQYITGDEIQCDLYYRDWQDTAWGMEKSLPNTINTDSTTVTHPSIGKRVTTDHEVLFFASDRPGGKGKMDIWMTEVMPGGEFGAPENLRDINSVEDELSPQFHMETNTLYFSSEGYLGFGGFDVYGTEQNRNGQWSSPENVGYPINTSYHDIYFYMLDGPEQFAYLSSNRPGSMFLDYAHEACCYDVYLTQIPDLNSKLIVQTFDATTMDSLKGAEVILYNKSNNDSRIVKQSDALAQQQFPLKYNKDYEIVISRAGYFSDTVKFTTRKFKDTADILKKIFLKPAQLDLLTLVYDGVDSLPILGAEVSVYDYDTDKLVSKYINLDGNDFEFDLKYDKKYRVIANRKGFKSQSVIVDPIDHPVGEQLIKRIYLPLGDLDDFLPLVLYFENDHPNPKSWSRSTNRIYSQTFQPYYQNKSTYKQEYAGPLKDEKGAEAEIAVERFFETEVRKGGDDLFRFLSVLESDLKKGLPVNIYLKGYTSPRYLASYNYNLGYRRVNSVKNELMQYKDGALIPYMNSGQLNVRERSFGELESPEDVTSDLKDKRNSIFSVNASKERRVEIIGVDRE